MLPRVIDIKIKASHLEWSNGNSYYYTKKGARKTLDQWTSPFNKPQLVAHNESLDPIGRIMSAKIAKTKDPNDPSEYYVELTARITDTNAIEKIIDGRYYTVSVGSRAYKVICSECGQVLNEEGLCEHKKGSLGDNGEKISWIIDGWFPKEDSFVNCPADEYSGILEINLGDGWVKYTDFMSDITNILNKLGDTNMPNKLTDKKLSADERAKLPEKAFCGPNRTFPAHDESHVRAGLRLLGKAKLSDSTKAKIKACLYRKGKQYGITPTKDELDESPELLTLGLNDEWTSEAIKEVEDFFKENPDTDLPGIEDSKEDIEDSDSEENSSDDVDKLKKDELKSRLIDAQNKIKELEDSKTKAIDEREKKITRLEKDLDDSNTLKLQKENQVYDLLDQVAVLEDKVRKCVISNIVDLRMTDNNSEDVDKLHDKFGKRQLESLEDTLSDLRIELTGGKQVDAEGKIEDNTIQSDKSDSEENHEETEEHKSIFSRIRD